MRVRSLRREASPETRCAGDEDGASHDRRDQREKQEVQASRADVRKKESRQASASPRSTESEVNQWAASGRRAPKRSPGPGFQHKWKGTEV